MRRFTVVITPVPLCGSLQLLLPPLASSQFTSSGHLMNARRQKATFLRVANRKRVEMFVGKRFHLPTRLQTAAPDIAQEWDHEKNPMHLYPEIVGIGYVAPVWWKCSKCKHSFSMGVEKRVVRGGGCPVCAMQETTNDVSVKEGGENVLEGEENKELRPKRPVMFNLRTKY
ncbi:putative Zinc-ribbon domain [Trypanosoma melophagium]|uniref:putative Zinc-ribbon domain n=1 Tax=Trypanosoma melophagium TaxID=715481 RepID=UPI00351A5F7B|nr:putative Zinc-ribbon domain [Trypanosoma melophagium]